MDTGVPTPVGGIQAELLATRLDALEPAVGLEVDIATSVADAMKLMRDKKHGSVVVTKDGAMAGIFTERDVLMKIVGREVDPAAMTIGQVMTEGPQHLRRNDPLAFAIHLMAVRGFRHIPVVREEKGKVDKIGIVSIRGIVGYLTKKAL
jgi:CBS domain-containing protein